MSRYLLDANALIALGWPAPEHHQKSQAWFKDHARHGWVIAPFTQAAFVRVVSQPAFSGKLIGPREAAELLARNLMHRHHSFFPHDMQIAQVAGLCTGGLVGHRAHQVGARVGDHYSGDARFATQEPNPRSA